ncbi:ketoacyl-synt-domain-containing protein [Decorospora gaudefroyi]|uniref:Ketoacyl-synt-domain-containing protein n=1 Tax=Decorospora gaudefroyi TaxID=184978 RepID=A0A6A5K615_9PLEO|nr:ketoacyl-synt-domain-containing protein [Decorospora gaudefroyi]
MNSSNHERAFYGDAIEPIAIVGAACRFPGGATTLEKLWNILYNKRCVVSDVPTQRFDVNGWYHPDPNRKGSVNTKKGFFLQEDVSLFDAAFFAITSKEAAAMDPMCRLLLEVAYEAFENAGHSLETLSGSSTAVFTGCMTDDYEMLSTHDTLNLGKNAASGVSRSMLSNRLSWFFDLRGPSLTLDTACSSSLYALHLACQSLRLGESNMGLVTGVNLILHPNITQRLTAMRMTSPDGMSHSFDSRANGYGRGEAVGALIVKRLADALKDGDTIRAVIRGSGANQDGHTPGITMPNAEAQAQLIRTTYEKAALDLNDTAYFEAHGTGTSIGDPVELSAVGATFGQPGLDRRMPLYVGSVKANIGHTEGCAGLAGVFKAVLCLEKGVICPTPGIENFNARLKLADWNINIPVENTSWPSSGSRRASVQSFGFGGSNAHVLLEDAASYLSHRGLKGNHTTLNGSDTDSDSGISTSRDASDTKAGPRPRLLVFSSRDQSGLDRLSQAYHQHARDNEVGDDDLDNLAYTLWKKRSHLDHRSFTIADSATSLQSVLAKGLAKVGRTVKVHEIAYVFTGQGAQWAGMGGEMLENSIFASSVQKSQTYLDRLGCPWNAAEEFKKLSDSRIDEAQFSQPLCTILQIGLVDVLAHWGIRPTAAVGHSSGAIGAAYAAHLLSHGDAIKVAYYRGILSADVSNRISGRNGAMMAAGISEEQACRYIQNFPEESVVVACINSPSSVTLSGDAHYIEELTRLITNDGHFARLLKVATAYHSPHMRTISDDYLKAQGAFKAPLTTDSCSVAFFSSVTGRCMPPEQPLGETYWVQNLCSPVRFFEAVQSLLKFSKHQGHSRPRSVNWTTMIEIGPHSALKGPLRQIMSHTDKRLEAKISYHSLLTRGANSEITCMSTAGRLWATGLPVDIARVNERIDTRPSARCLNNLPTYPWNHQNSFWHEPPEITAERSETRPRSDLLGSREQKFDPLHPRWRNFIRIVENPWIADHVITGSVLYPAAGMLVMAMEASAELCAAEDEIDSFMFEDIHFEKGLLLTSHDEAVETSLSLQSQPSKKGYNYKFVLSSLAAGLTWTRHCYGTISVVCKQPKREVSTSEGEIIQQSDARTEFCRVKEASAKHVDPDQFYQSLRDVGMAYGPLFANVTKATAVEGKREAWGVIQTPNTRDSMPYQFEYPCFIHPATLDAIFHLLFVAFTEGGHLPEAAVPVTLEKMQISAKLPTRAGVKFVGYSKLVNASDRESKGDLAVWAEDTNESIVIRGFALRQVSLEISISTTKLAETPGVSKRCAVLAWNVDLDFLLSAPRFGSRMSISGDEASGDVNAELYQIIEAACHKIAQLRILICGFSPEDVEYFLRCQSPNSSQTRRAARWTMAGMRNVEERGVRDALSKVLGSDIHHHVTFKSVASVLQGTFDLVLANATSPNGSDMINSLSESKSILSNIGQLLVVHQSGSLEKLSDADLRPLASCKDDLTITVASAPTLVKSTIPQTEEILLLRLDLCSERISKFEALLQQQFRTLGQEVRTVTIRDVTKCYNANVISMLELEHPFSMSWTDDELVTFKTLVSVAKHVLWVTRGGIENTLDSLDFSGTTGLLRTIRTEASTLSIPQLSLSNSADITSGSIVGLVRLAFELSLQPNGESEWAELNGELRIPRVVEHESFDRELNIHRSTPQAILAPMDTSLPMMLSAGDGMVWVEDDARSEQLASEALEIKVEAAYYIPIATAEKSWLSEAHTISVGTIAQVGSVVEHFTVGDRVLALDTRGYRTFVRSPSSLVHRIPAGIGNLDVSRKFFQYLIASYCFTSLAPVHTGTSVLVHHAGTSFGQAAISVALHHSARVMATVRTLEEKETLLRCFSPQLDEEDIFDTEDRYLSEAIMRATNQRGINTVYGELLEHDLSVYGACVASLGHIMNTNTGLEGAQIPAQMFKRGASITNVEICRILSLERAILRKCIALSFEVLRSGTLQDEPPPRVHTPTDLNLANLGEGFVLSLESEVLARMLPEPAEKLRLDPTGTYVLAGGLGALGLHLISTMIEHGARHVVILSRTPEGDRKNKVDSLRALNCTVDVVKCNVTDAGDVQNFVDECLRKQWRVQGVVQCAMVMRDSIFENMDLHKWNDVARPKILGSWNLHQYLPRDVDFFILLSSIVSIIGNTAQSNYAAGNSYQDALAHFRRSQGLAAVSLNVGLVSDGTHFDDAYSINDYLKTYGHMAGVLINSKELDVVLLAAMRGRTADGVEVPPQLIAGINANLQRSGQTLNTWMKDRKFDHRVVQALEEGGSEQEDSIKQSLLSADSLEKAATVVEQALRQSLATAMTASADDINVDLPIFALGVDSLKAVELRNWVRKEIEAEVSVFELLRDQPLSKLSWLLAQKSALFSVESVTPGV